MSPTHPARVCRRALLGAVLLGVLILGATPMSGCIRIPMGEGGPIDKLLPAEKPEPEKSTPVETAPPMVGTTHSAGSWKVTVVSAKPVARGPNDERPASGKEFLPVEVEFRNARSTETLYVDPRDVTLTDDSGKKVRIDNSNPGYNARGMPGITPGMGGTAVFLYQIPKGSSEYVFTFAPKVGSKRAKMQWGVP